MSIGYASAKSLNNPYPMRRWSQQVSYSEPTPSGNSRRVGTPATLTSLTFSAQNGASSTTSIYQFPTGSLDVSVSGQTIDRSSYNTSSTGAGTAPGGWPTGLGDWCYEGWLYVPSSRSRLTTGTIGGMDISSGLMIRIGQAYNTGGFNHINILARGAADCEYINYTWANDTWTHWAVQRKSNSVSFWVDGNKIPIQGFTTTSANFYNFGSGTGALTLGSYAPGTGDEGLAAYLDEVCMSNSWRYDDTQTTYTIPSAPFIVDEYTCLLMHFDGNLDSASS